MTWITNWRDFGSALVVLAITVVFLLWTQTVPTRAAAMPTLVAWLAIALALVDVVARTNTPVGRTLRRFVSAENVIEWKVQGDEEAGIGRVLRSILWVVAYLGGVYLVGFLLMTPAYVFFYMILQGKKSISAGVATAILTTFAIWLVFEIAFKYALYPGVLLGGH